jgi:hypothetical protein
VALFLEEDQRLLGEELEGADFDDGVGYGGEVTSDVLDVVVGNVFDVVLVRPTSWPWPTYGGSYGARSGPRCDVARSLHQDSGCGQLLHVSLRQGAVCHVSEETCGLHPPSTRKKEK